MTFSFMKKMQDLPYILIQGSMWLGDRSKYGVCFWSIDDHGDRGFGIKITSEEIRVLFFDGTPEDITFDSTSEGLELAKQTIGVMINNICSDLTDDYTNMLDANR